MHLLVEGPAVRPVLESADFGTWSMADRYREMGRRLGVDLAASIALLESLPVFLDGEPHMAARRSLARCYRQQRQAQIAAAGLFLHEFGERHLRGGAELDLMADLAWPLFVALARADNAFVRALPGETGDATDALGLLEGILLLFSPQPPLKRRFEVDRRLGQAMARHGADLCRDISLMLLGLRPLTGSLAWSLHGTLARQSGTPLSECRWPSGFIRSSLPFVDRVCRRETVVAAQRVRAGQRVRCVLDPGDGGDSALRPEWDSGLFFGAGPHRCLGRTLAEQVWAMTVELLSAQPLRARVEPMTVRDDDEPFLMPVRCRVHLEDAR